MRLPGVTLFFAFLFSSIQLVYAQTEVERQNRAVFNRVEDFFNTQQTDSIYQLANEKFKEQISQTKLSNILDQLYSLGNMQSVAHTGFTEGIATYTLDFETTTLDLQLGVDTNFRYGLFLIQPHQSTEQDELPVEHEPAMKDSVISNVDTKSELDLYVDSVARHYARNERVH